MEENLHNDNLERFFKENLERYSPSPSGDFWARMEPAIPPKPSVWQGLLSKYAKWVGMGLLLLTLATVFVLWRKDRQKVDQLSKQIAVAQQQLQQLSERQNTFMEPATGSTTVEPATAPETATANGTIEVIDNTSAEQEAVSNKPSLKTLPNGNRKTETTGNAVVAKQQIASKQDLKAKNIDNQLFENEATAPKTEFQAVVAERPDAEIQSSRPVLSEVQQEAGPSSAQILPTYIALVSSIKKQVPSVKHQGIKLYRKPYPRISVEVGSAAFAMPLARLFNRDTSYSGSVRGSWSANFSLHYELNPSWALHGGYEFKNIRTSKMALRYQTVPLLISKKIRLAHKLNMEIKTGLTVNKFYNRRTYSDGLSIRGRKDLWLGWQASAQIGIPVSKDVLLFIGPQGGTGITPFANGKRTWEAGLTTNIRYQF